MDEPTIENGFLTPSMKPQHGKLKNNYSGIMNDLYKQKLEPNQ